MFASGDDLLKIFVHIISLQAGIGRTYQKIIFSDIQNYDVIWKLNQSSHAAIVVITNSH